MTKFLTNRILGYIRAEDESDDWIESDDPWMWDNTAMLIVASSDIPSQNGQRLRWRVSQSVVIQVSEDISNELFESPFGPDNWPGLVTDFIEEQLGA